jgi:hypothetical protein
MIESSHWCDLTESSHWLDFDKDLFASISRHLRCIYNWKECNSHAISLVFGY